MRSYEDALHSCYLQFGVASSTHSALLEYSSIILEIAYQVNFVSFMWRLSYCTIGSQATSRSGAVTLGSVIDSLRGIAPPRPADNVTTVTRSFHNRRNSPIGSHYFAHTSGPRGKSTIAVTGHGTSETGIACFIIPALPGYGLVVDPQVIGESNPLLTGQGSQS